ncbi:MAG TPA: glycosyltransferase family 9 protein, partial [Trebonia sp.]
MPPSIVILRALGLGDFLTGVPAYRAVRRAFPGHRLVLAAPAVLAPLVPLAGAVDELLPVGELQPLNWTGAAPDIAIDLHGRGPASHLLVAALRPRRLIVFGGEHAGGFTGPVWRPGEHEVAR